MFKQIALIALIAVAAPSFCAETEAKEYDRNVVVTSAITTSPAELGGYVSGTYDEIEIRAKAEIGTNTTKQPKWDYAWLTDISVKISGETVLSWSADPNNPVAEKIFHVYWDTTHFPYAQLPEIECVVRASAERIAPVIVAGPAPIVEGPTAIAPADAATYVTIYNWAYVGEIQPIFSAFGQQVADAFKAMNYGVDSDLSARQATAAYGVENNTAYFFHGHGANIGGITCYGDEKTWSVFDGSGVVVDSPEFTADSTDVTVPLFRIKGLKLGVPPMNFAFLDVCMCGETCGMANGFLKPDEPADFYSVELCNQAEAGWKGNCYSTWSAYFTPILFNDLASTMTVYDSLNDAWTRLVSYLDSGPPNVEPLHGGRDADSHIGLYGDWCTRVHGLYDALARNGAKTALWYEVKDVTDLGHW